MYRNLAWDGCCLRPNLPSEVPKTAENYFFLTLDGAGNDTSGSYMEASILGRGTKI